MQGAGRIPVFLVLSHLLLSPALLGQEGAMTPQAMAPQVDVIGVATVTAQSARIDPRNNMIYTDYTLNFTDVWKGDPENPFILMKAGGQVGDRAVQIAGRNFQLATGQSIVVFAAPSSLGNHVVLGIDQGLYQIREGAPRTVTRMGVSRQPVASLALSALKEQVFRALGKSVTAPPSDPSASPEAPLKSTRSPSGTAPETPAVPSPPDRPRGDTPAGPPKESLGLFAVVLLLVLGVAAYARFRSRPRPKP
jgi:hypothetical protein